MAIITQLVLTDTFRAWVEKTNEIIDRLNSVSETNDSLSVRNLAIGAGGTLQVFSTATFTNPVFFNNNVTLNDNSLETTIVNGTLSVKENATFDKTVTAERYFGDGSQLTGISTDITSEQQVIGAVIARSAIQSGAVDITKLDSDISSIFEPGTRMLFHQPTAPRGWAQDTSFAAHALRVGGNIESVGRFSGLDFETVFSEVTPSGTVSVTVPGSATSSEESGGTITSSTNLSIQASSLSGSTGGHAITVNEMPSHTHTYIDSYVTVGRGLDSGGRHPYGNRTLTTNPTGGNQPHSHSLAGAGSHTHNLVGSVVSSLNPGSTSHEHSIPARSATASFAGDLIDLRIKYTNVIICEKE